MTIKPETVEKIEKRIAELSKKRDLQADLQICDKATPGPWVVDVVASPSLVCTEFEDEGSLAIAECDLGWDSSPDSSQNAQFIAAAREGWLEAIRRAITAEAEVKELKNTVAVLEALNSGLDIDCNELMAEVERLQVKLKDRQFLTTNCENWDDCSETCGIREVALNENGKCTSESPIYTD